MKSKVSTKRRRLSFAERETQVLEAALDLFAKSGFKGTTTKKIAQQANVNEALLFQHYPSKEKLYHALIKYKMSRFDERFLPALEKTLKLPMQRGMEKIAEIMLQKMREDKMLMRMVLFAALENPRSTRMFFRQRMPLIEFLNRFFIVQKRRHQLKRINTDTLSRAFFAMIYHYFMARFIFGAPDSFFRPSKRLFHDYIQFLLKGVKS